MKNLSRIPLTIATVFALYVSLPTATVAQPYGPREGGRRERIEQLKKMKLIETLNLDEEQAVRFFAKYNKYERLMQDLNRKRNETIDGIHALPKEGAGDPEYDKLIGEVIGTERQIYEAKKQFLEEVKEVLSPKQIGQLIVFERNFWRELQRITDDLWKERMQRPVK